MKKLKYIIILLLSVGLFNSCLIDNETDIDLNAEGANVAGFANPKTLVAAIADGAESTHILKMKISGPTVMYLTADITATVAADESSTAIEGTHFRIDNPTITLSASNNYLGLFEITMLTAGIQTPLDESPVLVLKVTNATGDSKVLNSGKLLEVTMNYACFSALAGTYDVTTIYTGYDGSVSTLTWTENITEIGLGSYRTTRVGHWTPDDLGGTPGFTFTDVCGQLSISGQNLVDLYSNWVEGTEYGTVAPVTGDLHMLYSICTATGCRYYDCTYIKK